jgi:hypothetical protein
MRIAHIFERSGDVIGAIFMYREVILSQDEISAPLAKERLEALARCVSKGTTRASSVSGNS